MNFLSLLTPFLKWHIKRLSKKNLPDYNASFDLKGLEGEVNITRDKWGVPHIKAQSEHDLFFAQGFLHAQDRLWQMEMNRRIAQGRISEIFGDIALDADRVTRTLGFARLAKQDWQRYQDQPIGQVAEAFAKGVNAFLAQQKALPPEFKLLRFQPEAWSAEDIITYGRFICFKMSYGWIHELERMKLANAVGVEKAVELHPEYPNFNPTVLPDGIETYKLDDGRLEAFNGPYLQPLGGSNNWSVTGSLMEGGHAALCNDPHLALNMPNIWYENHLICPEFEVTGVSLVGIPLVLIGHNQHIAWGATLSFIDLQDTYIEQFTDDTFDFYQFGEQQRASTKIEEKIYIKGKKQAHIETVIHTHHGPVISDILEHSDKKISLCSRPLQENDMMVGFYALNKAKHWNDFVDACSYITAPSLNLNYADTDQNIGYYVTGSVPIRKKDEDLFPRKGWLTNYEWNGRVPFEEMPHAFNPKRGYLYSCNNKVVADDFPYDLGNVWMNGYRAHRLQQLFDSKEQYSLKDFARWQMDLYSIPGEQYRELVREILTEENGNLEKQIPDTIHKMVHKFLDWDAYLTKESVGGCIYQVLKHELVGLVVGHQLDASLVQSFRGHGPKPPILFDNEYWGHDTTAMLRFLKAPEQTHWLKDTPAKLLIAAFEAAQKYLQAELGKNMANWQWGQLHQMELMHVLGAREPMDRIFNIKNIALGGDTDTLCQLAFQPGSAYEGTIIGASYRQLIDMGDFEKSWCIAPVGQSGNLISPHRENQLKMWLNGELKPMVWSDEQINLFRAYECTLMKK